MKLFELQLNSQNIKVWIWAKTNISAFRYWIITSGEEIESLSDEDEIIEITQEKWSELRVLNDEYDPEDEGSDHEYWTIQELTEGLTKPEIIATIEI